MGSGSVSENESISHSIIAGGVYSMPPERLGEAQLSNLWLKWGIPVAVSSLRLRCGEIRVLEGLRTVLVSDRWDSDIAARLPRRRRVVGCSRNRPTGGLSLGPWRMHQSRYHPRTALRRGGIPSCPNLAAHGRPTCWLFLAQASTWKTKELTGQLFSSGVPSVWKME